MLQYSQQLFSGHLWGLAVYRELLVLENTISTKIVPIETCPAKNVPVTAGTELMSIDSVPLK